MNSPLPGTPTHVCTVFWLSKNEYLTCVRSGVTIINSCQKIDPILKLNNYTRRCLIFALFPHESPNVHAVFSEIRPWTFAHVLFISFPKTALRLFVFSPNIVGLRWSKFVQKCHKNEKSGKHERKPPSGQAFVCNDSSNACAKIDDLTRKNGAIFGREYFSVVDLEPACS